MTNDIHARRRAVKKFSRARKRLREIERIIADRHGCVPATDDADLYLEPVANCFHAIAAGRDRSVSVDGIVKLFWFWCQTWAPHVSSGEATDIVRHVHAGSPKLIADDIVGKALRLTYADRLRLKIRTIGSFDADKALRAKLAKARRRERDRLRAAEKRRANGATPRANSLSQTKPWEEMGISRRTYERRQKKAAVRTGDGDANSSPHPSYIMGRRNCDRASLDLRPESLPVAEPTLERRAPQASRRMAPSPVVVREQVLEGEIVVDSGVGLRPPPPDRPARGVEHESKRTEQWGPVIDQEGRPFPPPSPERRSPPGRKSNMQRGREMFGGIQ